MGILDTLADWFRQPSVEVYQCKECEEKFKQVFETCPECGGEVVSVTDQSVHHFGYGMV